MRILTLQVFLLIGMDESIERQSDGLFDDCL